MLNVYILFTIFCLSFANELKADLVKGVLLGSMIAQQRSGNKVIVIPLHLNHYSPEDESPDEYSTTSASISTSSTTIPTTNTSTTETSNDTTTTSTTTTSTTTSTPLSTTDMSTTDEYDHVVDDQQIIMMMPMMPMDPKTMKMKIPLNMAIKMADMRMKGMGTTTTTTTSTTTMPTTIPTTTPTTTTSTTPSTTTTTTSPTTTRKPQTYGKRYRKMRYQYWK